MSSHSSKVESGANSTSPQTGVRLILQCISFLDVNGIVWSHPQGHPHQSILHKPIITKVYSSLIVHFISYVNPVVFMWSLPQGYPHQIHIYTMYMCVNHVCHHLVVSPKYVCT